MSKRVCVIDLPGMSRTLLEAVPVNSSLGKWIARQPIAPLTPSWPAVTCSVQATLTTGTPPSQHGIIANGLATFRSPADQKLIDASSFAEYRRNVSFWEQSNQLVESPRFWTGRWKTALLFFQNSMPGFVEPLAPAADIVITPRPVHGADGRITSVCWSQPDALSAQLAQQLGPFPLMHYWGPLARIESSNWITAAARHVWREHTPTLQWVYLPHLDYDLQRFGPSSPEAARAVRDLAAAVDPLVEDVLADDGALVMISEYAMRDVRRFVQPNRLLAEAGLLITRATPDGKLVDYQTSRAFAMCDHQVAHVYVSDARDVPTVREALSNVDLSVVDPAQLGMTHRRAGNLLLEAAPDAWLDYRWWSSPADAPTFAGAVDIHRKPGYDPLELFFDPQTRQVSQNGELVRGSHGRVEPGEAIAIGVTSAKTGHADLAATDLAGLLSAMFET